MRLWNHHTGQYESSYYSPRESSPLRSPSNSPLRVGSLPDLFDYYNAPFFPIPSTKNASLDDQEAESSYTQDEPPAHGQTHDQPYYNQQGYDQQTESSYQQDKTFLQGQTSPQISADILAALKEIHPGLSTICEFRLNENAPKISKNHMLRKSFVTPRFNTEKALNKKMGYLEGHIVNMVSNKIISRKTKIRFLLADWFAINKIERDVTTNDEKELANIIKKRNNSALKTRVDEYFKAMDDGLQDVIKSKIG